MSARARRNSSSAAHPSAASSGWNAQDRVCTGEPASAGCVSVAEVTHEVGGDQLSEGVSASRFVEAALELVVEFLEEEEEEEQREGGEAKLS